jgi:hypothetical protein
MMTLTMKEEKRLEVIQRVFRGELKEGKRKIKGRTIFSKGKK